jgi:hypothetical protein
MTTFMTSDGHVMDDRAVSCLIGASLPTEEACRAAVALLHTALAHQVSLADLWELSRIAVWGGGLVAARCALRAIQAGQTLTTPAAVPAASAAPLAWSETITWEDEPSLVPAPAMPARMPPASLAWSEQITWDEDEAPPTPPVTASDEIMADFDRALSQLSML